MARTIITSEKIKEINERFYICGVKAQVAREMGISASTVAKYIVDGYVPEGEIEREEIDLEEARRIIEDYIPDFTKLSLELEEEEKKEIRELWKELSI